MSTYYATTKDIPFNELVPRLAPFGITQMKIWRHPVPSVPSMRSASPITRRAACGLT